MPVYPSAHQPTDTSFLPLCCPTRGWIGSTDVTEINKVKFLSLRHSYITKREINERSINMGSSCHVWGVTKLEKVTHKLPGSHGDFTKEVTFESCSGGVFLGGNRVGPFLPCPRWLDSGFHGEGMRLSG